MAKKAANTASQESLSVSKKPAAAPRVHKHVKAQAAVAAVEEFVAALVHPAKPKPSHEEVSRLAYRLYLQRAGQSGSPAEDWLRAEQTLRG